MIVSVPKKDGYAPLHENPIEGLYVRLKGAAQDLRRLDTDWAFSKVRFACAGYRLSTAQLEQELLERAPTKKTHEKQRCSSAS